MATQGIVQNPLGTPGQTQTTVPYPNQPTNTTATSALTPPAPAPTTTYTPTKLPDPSKWTTTPDQTVAGQITNLTDPNSGIIQQARTRANQNSNSRGLLNSSIAQTAADDAAYSAAIPIAQADAAQAAKVAGYNADQNNQFAVKQQDTNTQVGVNNATQTNQVAQANLNSGTQKYLSDQNAQTQQVIKQLDIGQQTALANLANQNRNLIQNSSVASTAYTGYANTLYQNSIDTKLNAAARYQADQNAFNVYQQQIHIASLLAGVPDMSAQLNFTEINPNKPTDSTTAPGGTAPGGTAPGGTAPGGTAPGAAPSVPYLNNLEPR